MRAYSGSEIVQNWRYAISQDFQTSDGKPYPYATDGHRTWGDEDHHIPFDSEPNHACVSEDGSLLAVGIRKEIHVLETASWTIVHKLIGHDSPVGPLAFWPNDNNTLVSAGLNIGKSSTMLVWKLDRVRQPERATIERIISEVVTTTTAAAVSAFKSHQLTLPTGETDLLRNNLEPTLSDTAIRCVVEENTKINGEPAGSLFSPSGKWFVYLPWENHPPYSKHPRDIVICSAEDFSPHLTLKGHTDKIVWTGWSADESMFASVCWDGTARVWDPATGEVIMEAETGHQNWIAGFSPDSQYFVFTDGLGRVRIHKPRQDPSEHWVYGVEERKPHTWRRALSWHVNSRWLAVGGEKLAQVLLLDVENKSVLQERLLSAEGFHLDGGVDKNLTLMFFACIHVKFVDNGHKIVTWNFPDTSIEILDIKREVKWRFARGGTEDGDGADKWRDEHGKVTSRAGHGVVTWENRAKGVLLAASLDFDGIRVWSLPLTEGTWQEAEG